MDVVVTSAGMQACDRHAIARTGIPSAILMENSGREVAAAVGAELRRAGGKRVTILCGPGNNGGDGLVAARHLAAARIETRVVLVGRPSRLKGDPLVNHSVLRRLLREPAAAGLLALTSDPDARNLGAGGKADVIVDALFGTGFHGAPEGAYSRAIEWINRQKGVKIAVDLPSGLDADSGRVEGSCVRADVTVTMGLYKVGLLTGMGPAVSGEVRVAGLGAPLRSDATGGPGIYRVSAEDVRRALPVRPFNAHKHSVGKVLVLAGSTGFTGAAALCAQAAMRTGAGAVILATPKTVYPVLARKLTEVMVRPVPDTPEGTFGEASLASIEEHLPWADVVIAGPGIGRGPAVQAFVKKLLRMRGKRLLLDADALNCLALDRALAGILKRNTCILTPHTGEFSRLSGLGAALVEAGRVAAARTWAVEMGVTLVLKGAPTVTAEQKGAVYINSTGNPGMATAGMGDVLAGIIGALWAAGAGAATASWCGVHLHGRAGDSLATRLGQRSVMAGDLLNEISKVVES